MNKDFLPYFNSLEQKYKDAYMEWSKEQLIDHLVANIKNGEVLLSRIEKAIEYIEKHTDKLKTTRIPKIDFNYKELLETLKGETK